MDYIRYTYKQQKKTKVRKSLSMAFMAAGFVAMALAMITAEATELVGFYIFDAAAMVFFILSVAVRHDRNKSNH